MKNTFYVICSSIIYLLFSISCGNPVSDQSKTGSPYQDNTNTKETKIEEEESNNSPEISGVYSGTDNVGMETTIILQRGGTMVVQPSVGDGTPAYGRWEGTHNELSLYINDEMGGEQLLGDARVTESGLQIIGGRLYARQ